MMKVRIGLAGAALAVGLAACGGHTTASGPLVGTWEESETADGLTATAALDLKGDGTASLTVSLSGGGQAPACTGMLTLDGYTWTATSSSISLSVGTPTCSGKIDCEGLVLDCDALMSSLGGTMGTLSVTTQSSTCDYTLSSGDDTLTITCASDAGPNSLVLTRQGG